MGLLACKIPVEARERARREIPARTLEERAIVRVHVLDPVAVAIDSRVLSVFLAMW